MLLCLSFAGYNLFKLNRVGESLLCSLSGPSSKRCDESVVIVAVSFPTSEGIA